VEYARLKGIDPDIRDNKTIKIISYFRSYGRNSKEVRPTQDIKRADTPVLYKTIAVKDKNLFTCTITRGFRHQIRAHLAALGHPVLGDDLYGDRDFNRLQKARALKLCSVSLSVFTEGRLPLLDGKTFEISPPF
jgi:23S rRNA-/tRNA-specific pseudouridylate synthase